MGRVKEKPARIDGEIDFMEQPDIILRRALYIPEWNPGREENWPVLTLEQAMDITGIKNPVRMRELIGRMGMFEKRNEKGWTYDPGNMFFPEETAGVKQRRVGPRYRPPRNKPTVWRTTPPPERSLVLRQEVHQGKTVYRRLKQD